MKNILLEKDENEDGHIDKEEFIEALRDIDDDISYDEIDAIYTNLTNGNTQNEVSILKFLQYLENRQNNNNNDNNNSNFPFTSPMMRTSISASTIITSHSSISALSTPKTVLHKAFP